jgi:hypothetical protein
MVHAPFLVHTAHDAPTEDGAMVTHCKILKSTSNSGAAENLGKGITTVDTGIRCATRAEARAEVRRLNAAAGAVDGFPGPTGITYTFEEEAAVEESEDAPTCVRCGTPYDHGCNSDFCSLACEESWHAIHPEARQ